MRNMENQRSIAPETQALQQLGEERNKGLQTTGQ